MLRFVLFIWTRVQHDDDPAFVIDPFRPARVEVDEQEQKLHEHLYGHGMRFIQNTLQFY